MAKYTYMIMSMVGIFELDFDFNLANILNK